MKELLGLLLGIGIPGLAIFIFWLICYFEEDSVNLRKVRRRRVEWYRKYPIGTRIEVITYKRKQYNTQFEMENQKPDYNNKECKYYTIVEPKDYFTSWEGSSVPKSLYTRFLDNEGVLLVCRGDSNSFKFFTTENLLEIHQGWKELHKVSDVKMKILELKGRESGNEIVKSYSNSRKKNYRKGVKSR